VLLAGSGDQEQAKLIDFGLVKLLTDVLGTDACQRLTRTGVIFGTPEYMAPEQMVPEPVDPVDHRCDLYAVGILLFEMLCGRRPFEADEITQLWRAHLTEPPPSLRDFELGLDDPDLDAILQTLLAKRPSERFASALAVRRALESLSL
jgi:serine/threonine-protein kinase